MKRWPVIGLVLAVLWLFVRDAPVENMPGELLIGLMVGGGIAFTFRRMFSDTIDMMYMIRATPYILMYVASFLKELLVANLSVAKIVLSPSMNLQPDVVEVPLRVTSDAAITLIANSITLTPGTLTMDYNEEQNALYVHGITGSNREGVIQPIRRWEDLALIIFNEDDNARDNEYGNGGGSR